MHSSLYQSLKFYSGIILILVLMLVSGFYASNVPQVQAERGLWVGHTREVISCLNVLESHFFEAALFRYEQNQSEYKALASSEAQKHISDDIDILQHLTVDNPLQQSRIASLKSALSRSDGTAFKQMLETMRIEENKLLQQRMETWRKALYLTQCTVIGSQLVVMALVMLIYKLLYKELMKRKQLAELNMAEVDRMHRIVKLQHEVATESLDLDTIMNLIIERTQELLNADGSIIELVEGDEMVYKAASGSGSPHIGLRININSSLSGKAVREKTVLICDDAEHDARVDRAACKRVGLRSMVVVPLLRKDTAYGVLKVLSSRPFAFNQIDIDALELLAGLLAARINDAGTFLAIREANASLHTQKEELLFSNAQFRELATIDGLTKLKNQRSFHERLNDEIHRAKRYKSIFSLIFIDVDHFKNFNDNFGHVAGDKALKSVAELLKIIAARSTDFIARYGGEEFAIILPETSGHDAGVIAERLRAGIESAPWDLRSITVSIGVSSYTDAKDNVTTLLKEADKALYEAKASGRNCVRQYTFQHTELKVI